jgi:hypothetical protein
VLGAELVLVDAEDHRQVRRIGRRRAEDHPLGSRRQVALDLGAGAELRGRLDDHVDPEVAPGGRRLRAFLLMEHLHHAPGRVQIAVAQAELVGKPAEDRVEAEQVGQRGRVGHVADRLDPLVLTLVEDAEDVPPDPSQPHQPNSGGHSK